MVWPTDDLTTTHLDAGTDDPGQARAEIKACVDKLKSVLSEVSSGATVWHSGNDGGGSGLDADLIDGQHGSYYRNASNINAGKINNAYVNTGAGNGLDSDLLDGQHGSYYQNASNITSGTLSMSRIGTDAIGSDKIASSAIGQSELGAGAVHRGELDTSSASGSTSITKQASGTVTLTGGTYSWWTGSADDNKMYFGAGNAAAGVIGLFNDAGGAGSSLFYRDERYINSSPPYDLGDGEIPLFVFAMVDSQSKVISIEVAPDPTWAYHGETNIAPQRIDKTTGRKYRNVKMVRSTGVTVKEGRKVNANLTRDILLGNEVLIDQEVEITTAFKNADIDTHPHPWVYNEPVFFTGSTLIMLNPYGRAMSKLYQIYEGIGASEVRDLILADYINIGDADMGAMTPHGVALHDFNFRNSLARS